MNKKVKQISKNQMESFTKLVKDFDEWSDSWAGDENDVLIGKIILIEFKYYLLNLNKKKFGKNNKKIHANYLWALGGEIIRELNTDETKIKNLIGKEILLKFIGDQGDPY